MRADAPGPVLESRKGRKDVVVPIFGQTEAEIRSGFRRDRLQVTDGSTKSTRKIEPSVEVDVGINERETRH
jgi:hypothetical protein